MDVPELVQEECFVEELAVVEKDRPPERKPRHVGGAKCPPADPQWQSAGPIAGLL